MKYDYDCSFLFNEFAQKFQWSAIPPLEQLSTDVFAGGPDISGTWDQYGVRLPSAAVALFLYCRETAVLAEEEDADTWDFYNPDTSQSDLEQAISLAADIIHLAGNYGVEAGEQPEQLRIPCDFPAPPVSGSRPDPSVAGNSPVG